MDEQQGLGAGAEDLVGDVPVSAMFVAGLVGGVPGHGQDDTTPQRSRPAIIGIARELGCGRLVCDWLVAVYVFSPTPASPGLATHFSLYEAPERRTRADRVFAQRQC